MKTKMKMKKGNSILWIVVVVCLFTGLFIFSFIFDSNRLTGFVVGYIISFLVYLLIYFLFKEYNNWFVNFFKTLNLKDVINVFLFVWGLIVGFNCGIFDSFEINCQGNDDNINNKDIIDNSNNKGTEKDKMESYKNSAMLENSNLNTKTTLDLDAPHTSNLLSWLSDKFEHVDTMGKLAISLLIGKSILLSCLTSITFAIYGDYFLNKFNIEERFPKLANIIKIRRKFQKYYIILNILLMVCVILMEVTFSIAVLAL
uniref:Uncharacterized protein n=1 Tax=Cyclocybe aegerita TaxID=1973307 RepID=A0A884P6H3_CYCAE|nr:hypothetical protein K4014_mgp36 [Cyclocybe aegerita]QQP21440.1 hypothetical protein [Cyclocybe aegerita]